SNPVAIPSDTIAAAMTASDSTPGTRKSTGWAKSVEIASILAKKTRIPSGMARVTMRFSPRRSCSRVSARVCATRARRLTLPSLFRGDLQEDFLERSASGLQRGERDVRVAQEARELRDALRGTCGTYDVLSGAVLDNLAAIEAERAPDRDRVESRRSREPDLVRDGGLGELGRRPERRQLAAGNDRDAVAQLLGFVHRMGREQHGDAAVTQIAHELPGRGARVGIHACRRLVEEDDLGPADERARERKPLYLAAGKAPHRRAGRVAQADGVEQDRRRLRVVVVRGEELQELQRLQPRIEPALLEHHSDARTQLGRIAHRI